MRVFSIFLLFLATILIMIGLLPFMFANPANAGGHTGSSGIWEMVVMFSFKGRPWFIISGILTLIISMYFLLKDKKIII